MKLYQLIERLKQEDPEKVIKIGFNNPHSYRGYYVDLAFETREYCSIKEMLDCALEANGKTYTGYKGGEFTMDKDVDCYLAMYGCCGDELSERLLEYMLDDEV